MTLEILVTADEKGKCVRKDFAKLEVINADTLLGLFLAYANKDWGKYELEIDNHFTPPALARAYIEMIYGIHERFLDVFKDELSSEELFETLLKTEFVYASPMAYQRIKPVIPKEKDDDQEFNYVAHYSSKGGIFVSLLENATLEVIKGNAIHEFGHRLHQLYFPRNYDYSDVTIKEMLAILLEEEEGINDSYLSKTPHGRAKELLRRANEGKLKGKTFAERWKLLASFLKHEDLESYIDGKLSVYGGGS